MSSRTLPPLLLAGALSVPACDDGTGSEPTSAPAAGGKADEAQSALAPMLCGFEDGTGRLEALEIEVLGGSLTPLEDGYMFELTIRDLLEDEVDVLRIRPSSHRFDPTLNATSLSAGWRVGDETSNLFGAPIDIRLESTDGVNYASADGLRIENVPIASVFECERQGAGPDSSGRLAAHVAANLDEILDAGAEQLGVDSDELGLDPSTLQCRAFEGHQLPGTDGVSPGTCWASSNSILWAIDVARREDQIVYSMTALACEDDVCPGQ